MRFFYFMLFRYYIFGKDSTLDFSIKMHIGKWLKTETSILIFRQV